MKFGNGDIKYEVVDLWAKRPRKWTFVDVCGVAVDRRDNVYAFTRGSQPIMVFDREGNLIDAWGAGRFKRPHGISYGPDDSIYCVDDEGQVITKYTVAGKPLMTLGEPGIRADTGYDGRHQNTIKRAISYPPFNTPAGCSISASGEIYVADGYGNAKVHKFSPAGNHLGSWGEPGSGPGQFSLVHSVAVDREDRVYVADRLNGRIQVFDKDFNFITAWNGIEQPNHIYLDQKEDLLYVAQRDHRVSIYSLSGEIVSWWGDEESSLDAGHFSCPHGIAVDSHGDLYVGEVCETYFGIDKGSRTLQKFVRVH